MEDFKELIYFALSLIAVVLIITLVSALGVLTGEMAEARNAEILSREQLAGARKIGEYDGGTLSGVEVIALLRENAVCRGGFEITVRIDVGNTMVMDASNYQAFTYEALTAQSSARRIDPGYTFLAAVNEAQTAITLVRV